MEKQKNEKTARLTKLFIVTALVCALAALCVALTVTRGGSAETPVAAASVSAAEHDAAFGTSHSSGTAFDQPAGGELAAGHYYLTGDITLSAGLTVAAGATVDLCLNGYMLRLAGVENTSVITVPAGATLNIFDETFTESDTDRVHNYSGTDGDAESTERYMKFDGTSGDTTKPYVLGGIIGGAHFTVATGAVGVGVAGTLNMYGGAVAGNYGKYRPSGGTDMALGSVGVTGVGVFNFYDGLITGNRVGYGGGIALSDNAVLHMYGGTIKGNVSNGNGCVIYADTGNTRTEINGGVMTGNAYAASSSLDRVSSVYSSTLYLSGAPVITGNVAIGYQSGVVFDTDQNLYLPVTGNNNISSVFVDADHKIRFSGAITAGAQVDLFSYTGGTITEGWPTSGSAGVFSDYFTYTSANGLGIGIAADGEMQLKRPHSANSNYRRSDWIYGSTPSAEVLPINNDHDGATAKYYTDKDCTQEYTDGITSSTPVGTYYVVCSWPETDGYLYTEYKNDDGSYPSFSVTPCPITAINWVIDDFTYDGTDQAAKVTATYTSASDSSVKIPLTVTLTQTGASEFNTYEAGGYEFTASFAADDTEQSNYIFPTDEAVFKKTYTMKKAATEINTDGVQKEYTYNGREQKVESGATLNHSETALTYTNNTFTNVGTGTYTITVSASESANYLAASTTVVVTLHKKTVNVSSTLGSKPYNGAVQTADNIAETAEYTVVNNGGVDVGSYDVILTLKDGENYKWAAVEGDTLTLQFGITKAQNFWTAAPDVSGVTYGAKPDVTMGAANYGSVTVTYKTTGGVTLSGLPMDAGAYTAIFAVPGEANYAGLTKEVTFTITAKAITVTIENKTSVYGDELVDLTYTLEDGALVGNDTLGVTLTKAAGDNAGEYVVTGEWTNKNYAVSFIDGTYTITPRAVSVKINDATSVYGEAIATEYGYTLTEGTVIGNDTLNIAITKTDGATAGEYALTGTDNDNNYDITITPGTYTITKATYDMTGVAFDGLKVTYNGQAHSIEVIGLPAGVSVAYDKATSYTNAGEYVITATFTASDTENYNALSVTTLTATLAIDKATYDMTGVAFEGLKVTYNGQAHSIEVIGLPAGVSVAYDKATSYTNAGEYVITATFTASDTENYNALSVTTLTATLAIDKAIYDMTGVAFEGLKVTYDGQAHAIEVTGLPAGVSVAYDKETSYTNAGEYVITATFTASDTTNYNALSVVTLTATLTIDKAIYDMSGVAFEGLTVTYDGQAHAIEVTGLPAGVSVAYDKATSYTNAGEYVITATFTAADTENHNALSVTTLTATLTIDKAIYDMSGVAFEGLTVTYDGKAHGIEVTGLPAGVSVAYDKATSYTNAGEYVITASLTGDAENYNLLEAMTATLNITKATYDMTGVAFEGLTVTYDGQAHAIEVTGLPAGVSVAYDKATSYTNAGEYVITATFTASDTTNYNALSVTTLTATLTIDKAVYDMTGVRFSDATVTYNGAAHSIEATSLPTGVTVTYEGNGQTQAGTYTVKATFTGDANHEAIEAMEVTLTIEKAVYDLSVIAFDSITVTYDGASHSLAIAGTLPAGVTVTYENNGKTEVGTYTVIAKFAGDAENYELIANKTATLTINAQAVEPEPDKGGCGSIVPDGVTIGGIALAALVVGVILLVRRKRSK